MIVVYASDRAFSAVLMQVHDATYMPLTFTSRTLKSNELKYGTADKGDIGSSLYTGRLLHRGGHGIDQGADPILHASMASVTIGLVGLTRQLGGIAFAVDA